MSLEWFELNRKLDRMIFNANERRLLKNIANESWTVAENVIHGIYWKINFIQRA